MPWRLGWQWILESRAVVQDPTVINEEHVSRLHRELHTQVWLAQHPVQGVPGAPLGRCQGLPHLLVTGLDPVTQVAARQALAVPLHHWKLNTGRLAGPQSPAAVNMERCVELLEGVAMTLEQLVVDGKGAEHLAQAACP